MIVSEIQAKLESKVSVSECQLLLNDKPVELDQPVRFLNIPSHAKLLLRTGREMKLGFQDQNSTMKSQGGSSADPDPPVASSMERKEAHRVQSVNPQHIKHESIGHGNQKQSEDENDDVNTNWDIYIFTTADEQLMLEAASQVMSDTIDYDVNERDLRVLQAGLSKKLEPSELRTRQMREKDIEKKMTSIGNVCIRIELPWDMLMQFETPARSNVGDLYSAVKKTLKSKYQDVFVLYTTPPRLELKQHSQSLYQAGLIPAARVKLEFQIPASTEEPTLDALLPEYLSKIGILPPNRYKQGKVGDAYTAAESARRNEQESRQREVTTHKEGASPKKAPKWFKL